MIRFLLLVFIAIATFAILYLIEHPDVVGDIWLYFVGLAGAIIKLFKVLWTKIKGLGKDVKQQIDTKPQLPPVIQTKTSNEAVG